MSKLIQNAFYVPSIDKYFPSWNTHDFVLYKFPDGREIYYDGGLSYERRGGDFELFTEGLVIDVSLIEDSPREEIYNKLLWGTRGKNGDQPLRYRPIKEFTLEHLIALNKLAYISGLCKEVVQYWAEQKAGTNYI